MTMSSESDGVPDVTAGRGRVPDFFIVGHHKSGTTAMYEMLPEFFGRDLSRRREASPASDEQAHTFAGSRPHTLGEYLALFQDAEPGQRAGEASPSYLSSPTAAGMIAEVQPDARIIAILREPASFLRSLHLQMVRNHVQGEWDLRKAIAADSEAVQADRAHQYLDRVRYVDQLRRYRDAFSAEQVLALIYDDFRADNDATVRRVLRFLGVDAEVPVSVVDANPTVTARSRRLDDWSRSLKASRGPIAGAMKLTFKTVLPTGVRRRLQRNVIYGKAPAPDEALMRELRERFKGEVVALSEYLDRDLVSLWGYDRLG